MKLVSFVVTNTSSPHSNISPLTIWGICTKSQGNSQVSLGVGQTERGLCVVWEDASAGSFLQTDAGAREPDRYDGEVLVDDHTVVGRALAVIEAVAVRAPHIALAELAAITGIPKPTIFRIAASLVERGLLERTDGGYALGPELARLGEKASLQREFERYVPVLKELHAAYGGLAWLTAGPGLVKLQPVVQVCDSELVPVAQHGWPTPGTAGMLASTAGGHLVLAQRPDLLERIARIGLAPPHSPSALCGVGQLYASVQRAQRDGIAVESERSAPGWTWVAALLPSTTGQLAMIGATLPVGRAHAREIIRSVIRAFEAIAGDTGAKARAPG